MPEFTLIPNISQLIIGNWKMNGSPATAKRFAQEIIAALPNFPKRAHLVVCPPAPLLSQMIADLASTPFQFGAQDCHTEAQGAFTGDIAAELLAEIGARYIILGHSERRVTYGESDALVAAKVRAAHRAGLKAVVCVGETMAERERGLAETVIEQQLHGSLPECADRHNTTIAYEPLWAIGTGNTPEIADISAMHRHIHTLLAASQTGFEAGTAVLYGGSVKPANVSEILALPEVGGVLVGGASLEAADFLAIAGAC